MLKSQEGKFKVNPIDLKAKNREVKSGHKKQSK